jgi:hypothetical protein
MNEIALKARHFISDELICSSLHAARDKLFRQRQPGFCPREGAFA